MFGSATPVQRLPANVYGHLLEGDKRAAESMTRALFGR
jgi:hypothetical protein